MQEFYRQVRDCRWLIAGVLATSLPLAYYYSPWCLLYTPALFALLAFRATIITMVGDENRR
ncbi:hypothetical protein Mal64_15980 [Pseudobythopirellula maris]|uniref:Uncharacterized protein n=1 Tax=Pseudobythopirellula maris TaxID=2527991 RepID=A0A5C5ZM15_9BACT|nr:hypothetical protein [Pseudobythopirellula maris]TWT88126.1 hypothetical protein Mal64_15980 [Pseudobythopirellula maris]